MINLQKGMSIDLTKTVNESVGSTGLTQICLGLDWGKIKRGFFSSAESVDLDASVGVFDSNKDMLELVYFNNKVSKDGCIRHSGDDRGGDDNDDSSDNEVITIDLANINPQAKYITLVLNSYSGQDFGEIPYVRTRVYTGKPNKPTNILGSLNLANEASFKNKTSMVMAVLVKTQDGWEYKAVGEASSANGVSQLVSDSTRYL